MITAMPELQQRAHAREAEQDEDAAGHHRDDDETVVTVARDDAVHDDDERAGRTADLHAASAERGDEEAGHDRGVQPALRRHARSDRKRERERQCHDADDDAGDQIAHHLLARVALAKTDDRFGDEHRAAIMPHGVCFTSAQT
jgi:hypothetical protein